MSGFFVTGTDTDVGKTICSRAIIQALQDAGTQIVGYKPIACGCNEPVYSDNNPEQVGDYSSEDDFDVLTFDNTLPMLTQEGAKIRLEKLNQDFSRLTATYQTVLVEGSFGWLTPLNKNYTFADWVAERKIPVVLVVGIKEGCINHALLTAQSISQMGLPLIGWVANRINPCLGHYAEIIDLLKEKIDAPLLGRIPYIHKPEEQELGRFITDIKRLEYLKTVLAK